LYAHNSNCITLLRAIQESNSDVLTCSYEAADEMSSIIESLQFNFSTIKVATEDFSIANKLGEGEFSAVYKVI
jgi:hypothetical protein